MSRFINCIRSIMHGQVPTENFPITVTREVEPDISTLSTVYTLIAEWKTKIIVNPQAASMDDLVKNAMDKLRFHIYGDLYDLLIDLERYILEGNYKQALNVISKIKKETKG